MQFKATDEQLKTMAALAVSASNPMGLGFLHFKSGEEFKPDDFEIINNGSVAVSLDYVQGRMVKLTVFREKNGNYSLREPRDEYQSWVKKYPSAEALVKAAGVTEILPEV